MSSTRAPIINKEARTNRIHCNSIAVQLVSYDIWEVTNKLLTLKANKHKDTNGETAVTRVNHSVSLS